MKLPTALDDETIFSRLIRGLMSSHLTKTEFTKAILGNSRGSIHPYITSNLTDLAKLGEEDAKEIYMKQTLFPLFSFFMPKHRQAIIHSAFTSTPASAFRSCQLLNFRDKDKLCLKYCPLCAVEDIKQYGVSFWHRIHQLPGIESCHIHNACLKYTTLPDRLRLTPDLLPQPCEQIKPCSNAARKFAQYCAKQITYMTDCQAVFLGYHTMLEANGYKTLNGSIRRQKLSYDLYLLANELDYKHENLLPKSSRDYKYSSPLLVDNPCQHPFKQLFLGFYLTSKKTTQKEIVCKADCSKVDSSFLGKIEDMLLDDLSMAAISKISGKSRCFIKAYATKRGLPLNLNPRTITDKVKRRVSELAAKGFHRKEIASRFGISTGSVEAIISSVPGLVNHRKRCKFESLSRRRKVEITKYVNQHPEAYRADIKKACNSAFFWLYLNQPKWLEANLPKARKPQPPACKNKLG